MDCCQIGNSGVLDRRKTGKNGGQYKNIINKNWKKYYQFDKIGLWKFNEFPSSVSSIERLL
jgi:hypothetical protein